MAARFILSLDCEGKWGVADRLNGTHQRLFTTQGLRSAYSELLKLLDGYSIPATFAFVGLFGEPANGSRSVLELLDGLAERAPEYLGPACAEIKSGADGWNAPWAVEAVGSSKTAHEIALHGLTHVPWTSIDDAFARMELSLARELTCATKAAKTFVFPRNAVAHVDLLGAAGLEGYRTARRPMSRPMSLMSEFNVLAAPDGDLPLNVDGAVPIPAGRFVNARAGLRNVVPTFVSRSRFRHMLDRAERSASVVHLWMHPENLLAAPRTLDLLKSMLGEVASRRDSGRCRVLTQIEYVRERRHTASDGRTTTF